MLAIKLQRIGKKHQPSYRIVVAEKRSKLASPPVEDLGSYNPFNKAVTLNADRVSHWLKVGVKPTASVHNLLIKEGATQGEKLKIRVRKSKKEGAPEAATPAAPTAEAPAAVTEEPAPKSEIEAETAA